MKFSEIAKAIHASRQGEEGEFTRLIIDSRQVIPGDCFIAIKGERLDGHDFIAQAIQKGARAIIAARGAITDLEKSVCFLQVDDTTIALGKLAAYWRDKCAVSMIGVTGSCGKTSVKGMIQSICETAGKTLATEGNFNNHIGLPLTLLRLDNSYRYAVIEMGASAKGEIAYLGKIAKPTVTLITNVAPAHLKGFGTLDGVAEAKGEIYEILPKEGVAVLNQEEAYSQFWREKMGERKVLTFGLTSSSYVYPSEITYHPESVQFNLHIGESHHRVKVTVPGQHTVLNALASATAAYAVGISIENIIKGLEAFQGVPGRLSRYSGLKGASIIDDTYNANPGSMKAALEVLANYKGQTIFVMGDMAELGDNVEDYHKNIGLHAREKGISKLLAVGQWSKFAVTAFGQEGIWFPSQEALIEVLKDKMSSDTVILVKGSRSSRMEGITNAIIQSKE